MDEQEFLKNYNENNYKHPSVAVDVLIFSINPSNKLEVLLLKRKEHPFKDAWALPGGFVQMDENLEDTAKRVIKEKLEIENVELEQLYTFGNVERDPRTRVISITYMAFLPNKIKNVENAWWYEVDLKENKLEINQSGLYVSEIPEADLIKLLKNIQYSSKPLQILEKTPEPELAFDHSEIIKLAINRLRGKIDYTDIGFNLLKSKENFTIFDLQKVYEAVKGEKLDKPNFRRWFFNVYLKSGKVVEDGKNSKKVQTYKFVGGGK